VLYKLFRHDDEVKAKIENVDETIEQLSDAIKNFIYFVYKKKRKVSNQ